MAAGAPAAIDKAAGNAASTGAQEPPRLRQYFPETMLWLPDAVTDADGNNIEVVFHGPAKQSADKIEITF